MYEPLDGIQMLFCSLDRNGEVSVLFNISIAQYGDYSSVLEPTDTGIYGCLSSGSMEDEDSIIYKFDPSVPSKGVTVCELCQQLAIVWLDWQGTNAHPSPS
jgi:hypothetical protein